MSACTLKAGGVADTSSSSDICAAGVTPPSSTPPPGNVCPQQLLPGHTTVGHVEPSASLLQREGNCKRGAPHAPSQNTEHQRSLAASQPRRGAGRSQRAPRSSGWKLDGPFSPFKTLEFSRASKSPQSDLEQLISRFQSDCDRVT